LPGPIILAAGVLTKKKKVARKRNQTKKKKKEAEKSSGWEPQWKKKRCNRGSCVAHGPNEPEAGVRKQGHTGKEQRPA